MVEKLKKKEIHVMYSEKFEIILFGLQVAC